MPRFIKRGINLFVSVLLKSQMIYVPLIDIQIFQSLNILPMPKSDRTLLGWIVA